MPINLTVRANYTNEKTYKKQQTKQTDPNQQIKKRHIMENILYFYFYFAYLYNISIFEIM